MQYDPIPKLKSVFVSAKYVTIYIKQGQSLEQQGKANMAA